MKDLFDTRKYLEEHYDQSIHEEELKLLKVDIIGRDVNFKQKIKIQLNSVVAFFFSFMP